MLHDMEWELLKYTVDGQLGNCHPNDITKGKAYFIVRRRSITKRLDHIVDVIFSTLPISYFP